MLEDLLTTKLFIPPARPSLVARPRLLGRLNEGLSAKLILISAPAGFGKTTLLSEWAGQCPIPVAWVSLDEADNDPERFLAYLITAAQTIQPGEGLGEMALAMRQAPQPLPTESVLTTLVNEIAGLGKAMVLALDDYHVIDDETIHEMVIFLLEHLPPEIHLAISTRKEPAVLPLARLRARAQLTEIRLDDLRFSSEEAHAFLSAVMGLALSPQEIKTLEDRTEGWVAGLQLAALSLQGRDNPERFILGLSGADRFILDYLAEEVLGYQLETVQSFLLSTSILGRLSGPLCDAITGRNDSQRLLEQLEADNLFLIPLDDKRRWFRYHQLFGDFLRERLEATETNDVPDLHRRAAEWYAAENLNAEAISHALAAGNYDYGASVMERVVRQRLIGGELITVVRWLEALPPELIQSRPRLSLAYAWATVMTGQGWKPAHEAMKHAALTLGVGPGGVLETLSKCERPSESLQPLRDLALLEAFIVRQSGDLNRAVELFSGAIAYAPADDAFTMAVGRGGLGSIYIRRGAVREAERVFAEVAETGRLASSTFMVVLGMTMRGQMQAWQGKLNSAAATFQKALDVLIDRRGRPFPFSGQAAAGLADILREQNELDLASDLVVEGIALGEQVGDYDVLVQGHITQARLFFALGESEQAYETLHHVEKIGQQIGYSGCEQDAQAWQARFNLTEGDLEKAIRWATGRKPPLPGEQAPELYREELHLLTVARLLTAQGEIADSLSILENLLIAAERDGRYQTVIEILALTALAHQAGGRHDSAMRALARGLLLAETEGFIRTFVDEGPQMAVLLRQTRAQGHSPQYIERLLSAFEQATPTGPPLDPLSERELEVLGLMAEGLTNPQIAQELTIALSTVKTHINRIYSKLDVQTRTQAVVRARERNLI